MGVDLPINWEKTFDAFDCLFQGFKGVEELITALANEEIESKRSQIERIMISAFSFGLMLGLKVNRNEIDGEIEKIQGRLSELDEKMRELGILPPRFS